MGARFHVSDLLSAPPFGRYEEIPGVSPGTLALFDPTLNAGAFVGVPATGGVIPNAARVQAASILGVSDPSTLNFTHTWAREASNVLFLERSGKGGLHSIMSQTLQTSAAGNYARIAVPNAIRDYIFNLVSSAGDTGCLYAFLATRPTRSQIGSPPVAQFFIGNVSSVNNSLVRNSYGTYLGAGQRGSNQTLLDGNVYVSAGGYSAWAGTRPASAASMSIQLGYGGIDAFNSGTIGLNKLPSCLYYYFKLEDLSKTKRTHGGVGGTFEEEYAAAYAADLARLQTYFAPGGAFAGDTYTNPSAYP